MPPRRFASTRFRRPATPALPSRCGRLCVWALLLLGAGNAPAQTAANLTAAWTPLGPGSVLSARYGQVTGRVSALAVDPNDASGNTVYLGTTGGGVWKSTNAAGALGNVTFTPLTDTLPVFSANAGSGIVPSLTIGAIAVQPGLDPVLLAGTGDPNDATDSYYGEGLLRSTDGGLTWSLVQGSHDGANGNHSFTGLVTAGLAFSSATPTLAVAAMSLSPQAAIVNAAGSSSIPGLYVSIDAGLTWQMATIYDGSTVVQGPQPLGTGEVGNAVTSVVWDALRGQFFAAVRAHGYYASPDGMTWTRLAAQPGTGLTPANCPVGANGLGSANCPLFRGVLAVQPLTGDLYALTVDATDTDQGLWQDLCLASSNACAAPSPTFATRIDNGALEVGGGNAAIQQGSYDLALSAAPAASNGTLLFAGTVDLYRCSLAAGASSCTTGWRDTTNALDGCDAPALVAPAQHALAAVGQGSGAPLLFLGNDSGLWRSLDGVAETGSVCSASDASHFDNLNAAMGAGGGLAEVVGFAQDPSADNTLIAGLGANGSAATSTASAVTPWLQLSEGEGGFPSIDPTTPTNWYISIGAQVNIDLCIYGLNCTSVNFLPPATVGEAQVAQDAAVLDAPTLLDPALTSSLLTGTCRVWRGPAGDSAGWSDANALSAAFDGSATPCTQGSALIRSLGAGGPGAAGSGTSTLPTQNLGSRVLYAGMAGLLDGGGGVAGHLFVTASADAVTPGWTDASSGVVTNDAASAGRFNPDNFDISAVTIDTHDGTGGTVYATVMGFGVPHLYRSVDFGAHWLNLSANLPDAPANAVLVDPNDANTVYIAMDTGVYVTQLVGSCATSNCWSVLGTALPNSPVIGLQAGTGLATGDGRKGMLRAGTYGRGLWQTPLLTAVSLAQPAITLSATSFAFGAQQVGTQSAAQTLTITSTGNAPVTFGTPAITGDFAETDDCAGQTLAVNATCTAQIVFAPAVVGARTGQLTLYANVSAGGGQAVVLLSGTGTAPASIVLTPLSLTFAATVVNQTAAAQIITVANTGQNAATLQTPALTGADPGDFAISANTCGATLAASTACSVALTFTPTASGTRAATLTVTDSAGTQTAQLTGVGNAPATDTLTPLSLTFAQQQIGTLSAAQQVTLTNSGDVALTLIAASITAGDFAVTNACGNSLSAHSTCALSVTFVPAATGARTGSLSVSDQFRTQTVLLNGVGLAGPGVSLSPTSLSFPATGVGLTAQPQTLTLTNNGGVTLNIASVAASASFALATNGCGVTLAAGAACALSIVFTPGAAGALAGTLTLSDDATPATQAAVLTGTGIDFTLASNGPTTVTLPASGGSGTYPMLLSSLAGLAGSVAIGCSGAPAHATCLVVPSLGALGGTQTVAVTVETGVPVSPPVQTAAAAPEGHLAAAVLLALLLPAGLCARRRRAPAKRLAVIVMTLLGAGLGVGLSLGLGGCGADRVIPNSQITPVQTTPTPKGTYTLTVSGAAAGLTHSVQVTLVVQ